jgi:predicted flap endonuclease-1-like 5' DNA nuclease
VLYVLGEIALLVALALGVGAASGYLWWGRRGGTTRAADDDALVDRLAGLESALSAARREGAERAGQLAALRGELPEARTASAELVETRTRLETASRELEQSRTATAGLEQRIAELEAKVEADARTAEDRVRGVDAAASRIRTLETQLAAARNLASEREARVTELEAHLAATRREAAEHAAGLRSAADTVAQIESVRREERAELESLRARLDELDTSLERATKTLRSRERRIARLEAAAQEPPWPDDDLGEIAGIGPKVSELLRSLGITTFGQLAALDDGEIAGYNGTLEHLRARASRDDWAGQARRLHRIKYGAPIAR